MRGRLRRNPHATVDQRAEAIHRRMARLLRLLPNSASPHKPRSVDPSKIAFVSLAAMANQAKPLRGVTPSRRSKVPGSGRRWFTNRALAHVRTSGGPASPTQRLFQVARSSPNLGARPSLTRSNRRGTGPVCPVVWEGWRREASPYPDHHSDRGAQYVSIKYTERLAEAGIEPSVGSVGNFTTTPSPKRSMASTRPKSSIDADRGATSRPSSSQPSSGWTGSTIAGFWSPSASSRRPKLRSATSPC